MSVGATSSSTSKVVTQAPKTAEAAETHKVKPLIIQTKIYAFIGQDHPLSQGHLQSNVKLIEIVVSYIDLRGIAYPSLAKRFNQYKTELEAIESHSRPLDSDLGSLMLMSKRVMNTTHELAELEKRYDHIETGRLRVEDACGRVRDVSAVTLEGELGYIMSQVIIKITCLGLVINHVRQSFGNNGDH